MGTTFAIVLTKMFRARQRLVRKFAPARSGDVKIKQMLLTGRKDYLRNVRATITFQGLYARPLDRARATEEEQD